ncbi:MAG: hypothetical protein AMXMBFR48_08060 [Ignavibacteriales bacterium]|jgi:hypothetical protein
MKHITTAGMAIFLLLAQILLAGCGSDSVKPAKDILPDLHRLEGTWIRITRSGKVYEVWRKNENSTLDGLTFRVSAEDSLLTEKMRLFVSGDSLYYGAQVTDQNDGKEILFTLKAYGEEYIFENAEHDFPKRIRYSFPKEDELRVVIEDLAGEKRIFFNFFRH